MKPIIIILIFIIFDSYLIWTYAKIYFKFRKIFKNGISVSGEIIEYHIEEKKNVKTYFPIVKFNTFFGEVLTEKASLGLDYKQYLVQEKSVIIKYLEQNPKDFILEETNPTKSIVTMISYIIITTPIALYFLLKNEFEFLKKLESFLNL
ncbi:hypothetical protein EGI22_08935 [Lacihabitans sp. LS3-19]|uniref:hypothetical protein n=1 Tax=Lacihabitans sp. LS3-19 TaxID=2487335 RepID=UPI0020CBC1FD|nr:hypothetical protein [Lacihabitans sp. LS3-19]MCP9768037.1 hypothetical protein [Lacihabitans sp. LS3-19]